MLHTLNNDGPALAGHLEQSLHAQDAIAPRDQQSFEPCFEILPRGRFIPAKAIGAVTMGRVGGGVLMKGTMGQRRYCVIAEAGIGSAEQELVGGGLVAAAAGKSDPSHSVDRSKTIHE